MMALSSPTACAWLAGVALAAALVGGPATAKVPPTVQRCLDNPAVATITSNMGHAIDDQLAQIADLKAQLFLERGATLDAQQQVYDLRVCLVRVRQAYGEGGKEAALEACPR